MAMDDTLTRSPKTGDVDTRVVMKDAQPNSSPPFESFAIEEGCNYSIFVDSCDGPPRDTIVHRFCSWYSRQTEVNPLRTKSATGGICAIVGDILAQCIENGTSLRSESTEGLHMRRILAVFIAGLCYGPILHHVYASLEDVLPIHCDNQCLTVENNITSKDYKVGDEVEVNPYNIDLERDDIVADEEILPHYNCYSTMFTSFSLVSQRQYVNAFLHVAIDQGFMAFPFVAIMMLITGIVEGHWNSLGEEFTSDYIDNIHALWLASLLGIGPIQIIAFRFLPLKWRALAANILDVLEVMVMSYLAHRNREAPNQELPDESDDWYNRNRS
ncbi:hypothetical protein ACHAXA_004777 [Cyclostephanos tholiformis]|uniref:Uncharacterized protein n=1 Tax=Cyclostephanos tholiformis TaxID=382380 RepID=A0ABD3R306_9STRA